LLPTEQHVVPHQLASLVRQDEQPVRRWIRSL
jgi:hypothetical protein